MTNQHIPTDQRYQRIDQSLQDTAEVIRRAKQMINHNGRSIVESKSIGMVVPVSSSATYLNIRYNLRIQQSTHSSRSTLTTNQCILNQGQFLRPSVYRDRQLQLQPSFSFGSLKPPNINSVQQPSYPQEDQNTTIRNFKEKLNEVYHDEGQHSEIKKEKLESKYKDEEFIGRIVHDTNKSTKKVRSNNALEKQFRSQSQESSRSKTIDHEQYFSNASRDMKDSLNMPNSSNPMRIEEPADGEEVLSVEPIPQTQVQKGPPIPQIKIKEKTTRPFFREMESESPQITDSYKPVKKTTNYGVVQRRDQKETQNKTPKKESTEETRETNQKTPDRVRFKIDKRKQEDSTQDKRQESSKELETQISRSIQMRRLSDLGNNYKERMRRLHNSRQRSRSSHTITFNKSLKSVVSDCDQSQFQSCSIMCPGIQSCPRQIECPKFRREVERSLRQRFLLRFSYLYSEKYIEYDDLFQLYNRIWTKQIPEYRWEDMAKELLKKKQLVKSIKKSTNVSRYTTIV